MYEILMIVFLLVAIAVIGLILIQHGKGADMGASFGQGASGTVFGSAGSGNFLTKSTSTLAFVFFGIALSLSYINNSKKATTGDVLFSEEATTQAKEQINDADLPVATKQSSGDLPVAVSAENAGTSTAADVEPNKVDAAKTDETSEDNKPEE